MLKWRCTESLLFACNFNGHQAQKPNEWTHAGLGQLRTKIEKQYNWTPNWISSGWRKALHAICPWLRSLCWGTRAQCSKWLGISHMVWWRRSSRHQWPEPHHKWRWRYCALAHIWSLVAIEPRIPIGASETFQLNMEWISRRIHFECVVILLKSLILIAFALHATIFRAILFFLWQTSCNLAQKTTQPPATQ